MCALQYISRLQCADVERKKAVKAASVNDGWLEQTNCNVANISRLSRVLHSSRQRCCLKSAWSTHQVLMFYFVSETARLIFHHHHCQ